ncbi:LysR family transcriptional regulator [Salinisphaera sp. T5B8]|uniref:LysR substrate-binding domain-containing protein n=1 Tax=Salinisphaera sp. T5B8 TaxID=1304154 RepID=UPI00333F8819
MSFPSLSALRAFEAAARLGSFKAAAEALHLSPTAVSHHIRGLEAQLGVSLFVRRTRAITPTEAGLQLSQAATRAFSELEAAVAALRDDENRLTISTTPAFATLWLAPRIDDFEQRHPDLRIRLVSSTEPVDLERDREVDIAIRYSAADPDTDDSRILVRESVGAFASPAYLAAGVPIETVDRLATCWPDARLAPIDWATWQVQAGVGPLDEAKLRTFAHEQEVVQAALAGKGVALVSELLVRDMVARGWLVAWRPEIRMPGHAYRLITGPLKAHTRRAALFIAWLKNALAGDQRK